MKMMVYRTLGFFLNMMRESMFVFSEYSDCATYFMLYNGSKPVLRLLYVMPSNIRRRVADVKVRSESPS